MGCSAVKRCWNCILASKQARDFTGSLTASQHKSTNLNRRSIARAKAGAGNISQGERLFPQIKRNEKPRHSACSGVGGRAGGNDVEVCRCPWERAGEALQGCCVLLFGLGLYFWFVDFFIYFFFFLVG